MQTNTNFEKQEKKARFGFDEIDRTTKGKKLNKTQRGSRHNWEEKQD